MGQAFKCDNCGELFVLEDRHDFTKVSIDGKYYNIMIDPGFNLLSGIYTTPDLCGHCFSQILMAGYKEITTQK